MGLLEISWLASQMSSNSDNNSKELSNLREEIKKLRLEINNLRKDIKELTTHPTESEGVNKKESEER